MNRKHGLEDAPAAVVDGQLEVLSLNLLNEVAHVAVRPDLLPIDRQNADP